MTNNNAEVVPIDTGATPNDVSDISEQAPATVAPRGTGKKVLWISLVAILLVVLVSVAGTYFYQQKKAEQARVVAAKKAAAIAKEKALVTDFDTAMEVRAEVLNAEASAAQAIADAKGKVADFDKRVASRDKKVKALQADYDKEYQRAEDWNNDMSKIGYKELPSYPDMPDEIKTPSFSSQVKSLKQADSDLRTATARLTSLEIDPRFEKMTTQMKEVAAAISEEALHNADVLTTAVEPPTKGDESEDSAGYVDKKVFGTLRSGSSTALFTVINDDCLKFVKAHKLDIRLYDLAGGRDTNGKDSSLVTSRQ